MARRTDEPDDPARHPPSDFANRELSPPRVATALAVVAAVAAFFLLGFPRLGAHAARPTADAWFAPYVDVTLPPPYEFQDRTANLARDVVLAFVVAQPGAGCTPSWGGYYTPQQAATAVDVDRRIARLREQGGDVIVSFGGAANQELALTCQDPQQLEAAYRSVVRRYRVSTIEFDLEGQALTDTASLARRAGAVAALQRSIRATGGHLAVWLTLPVAVDGLPAGAVAAVKAMLGAHVDLAGVNVMAFDFGGSRSPGTSMLAAIESAVQATHRQLASAYAGIGVRVSGRDLWRQIGVTAMIGLNDTITDVLRPSDAEGLVQFVRATSLRRVSMWSLNRDSQCAPNAVTVQAVENYCSGVQQSPLGFSRILAQLRGRPDYANRSVTLPRERLVDKAATSPYPIWAGLGRYPRGWRVVWHGLVYEAKRWTVDEVPDAPVPALAGAPWEFVGPVQPGEHPPVLHRLKPGTHPSWDPRVTYHAGQRVLVDGLAYQAKWANANFPPDQPVPDPWDTPWTPLFAAPGAPVSRS
jgi:chitinase